MPKKLQFVVGVLLVALLAGCASLTKSWIAPKVALSGLQVKELGLARQTFLATLLVKNPNDRALPIKAMTYVLSLEGNEVARGDSTLEKQIPAFGEANVDVEVVSGLLDLAARLPALALKDEPLGWTIAGTFTLTGGLITLPYRYSGTIDPVALMSGAMR